jgi:hypothetical protein
MDWISLWARPLAGVSCMVAILMACGALAADPAPRGDLRVARLIRDLGAGDFSDRQDADEQLSRLGAAGRAELERALADDDIEVRLRAKRLLDRLELAEIWSAGRVQLHVRGEPASKILLALASQSGNHVHVGDPYGNFAEKPLDVDYDGISYWEAIDDVCRRTQNRVRPHYDMHTPGIVVSAGSPGSYPRAYCGPVRAQITAARRLFSEDLSYEDQKAELTHSFQFNLQFTWEDRFRIVGYAAQPELIEAVTDTQVAVSAAQPAGGGWNATSRGLRQLNAVLKLNPISVSAASLHVLKMKWGLIAVGNPAVLEMTDLGSGKPYSADDLVARVESLEPQLAGKYLLSLLVVRDMALPEPHEVLFQEYDVEMFDALGRPFRMQGQAHTLTQRGVQLKMTLVGDSPDSKPKSIKLHYPRLRARRDLELVFRNVPLPVSKPE